MLICFISIAQTFLKLFRVNKIIASVFTNKVNWTLNHASRWEGFNDYITIVEIAALIKQFSIKYLTWAWNQNYLKKTWGQNNNFWFNLISNSLKLFFFSLKLNGLNKKFQKLTCKPQLACFVCSFTCMTSLTSRYSLIIQNFATS